MVGEIEGLKPKRRDLRPIVRLQLQNKEGLKRFAVRSQLGLKPKRRDLTPIVRLQLQNKEGLIKRFAVRSQLGLKQNKEGLKADRQITMSL